MRMMMILIKMMDNKNTFLIRMFIVLYKYLSLQQRNNR